MERQVYERSLKSEPSIVKLIENQSEHLSKFVFKKISTIDIPKSSKLHRYVNKVRKLYHARYKCKNKRDPKIINLNKMAIPKKAYLLSFFSRHYHRIMKLKCKARRYLSLFMQNHSSTMQLNSPISSENLMQSRLGALCLQSIDVGGAGDCFFRSHQLYGNSDHHMHIRTAGVQFMRDNPERFIESNTENSWLRYLNNMFIQGTWADALIIQAVADALNVTIQIVESNQGFAPLTTVYPEFRKEILPLQLL